MEQPGVPVRVLLVDDDPDFLDSLRTYIATRQEYLNDLGAYWTAVFQLEQAVNTELRR